MADQPRNDELPVQRLHLPLRRPRALLVEDEFKALRRRRDLLRMKDLDVIPASSKAEALDRMRANGFRVDVVLTDLDLTPDGSSVGGIDGVDIALAISEQTDQDIPVYAYSGKIRELPKDVRKFFTDVVLKTDTSPRVREFFNRAASDAFRHFGTLVDGIEDSLVGLDVEPKSMSRDDVNLVRDLIPGAVSAAEDDFDVPAVVGFAPLTTHGVGVLYGITIEELPTPEYHSYVIGHEYLYGRGSSHEEAVNALGLILMAFAELIEEESSTASASDLDVAVGTSLQLRKLIFGLYAREEELQGK